MERANENLIPQTTRWLIDPAAQAVCRAIEAGGYRILFVGGCVRNALLGLPDSDIDLSTDALPEQVMALAADAGLKAVPTGIDHGTVTIISDGTGFEVTTFRRDVATDGRRAVVAFSDNIQDDARRRDFTMNALYATREGQVIDPLGGLPDLCARRIRFIEDADARIREDFLRILRFFRFVAFYDLSENGFEAETLDAIARNVDGLQSLSAERIGQEMRKLLAALDPGFALAGMRNTGVLHAILPGADDRWIAPVVQFEHDLSIEPWWLCRLAALGGWDAPKRWRLSKSEARDLALLQEVGFAGPVIGEIAYRHGDRIAQTAVMLRAAMAENPPILSELETIQYACTATFPIKAADLMPGFNGPDLGRKLAELERKWIDSGFALDRATLLKF